MSAGGRGVSALATAPLLEVDNLVTTFRTGGGWHAAVRNVSFDVAPNETLAIVGESGCGKSVTALSVMRLIPTANGRIEGGHIRFAGRDLVALDDEEMRKVRGDRISMIFQEPMTSLNPVLTVGFQVAEALRYHRDMGRREADAHALHDAHGLRPRGGAVQVLVQADRLDDLVADREDRIERRHRLLEDHRDVGAAELAQALLALGGEIDDTTRPRAQQHRAAGDASAAQFDQPHQRQGGDRLARSRLADERHRLAKLHLERDAVDRKHVPAALAKGDGEVLDGKEGGWVHEICPRII